ncbi:MAG TPA: hypothetical protein VF297_08665 [Pyrinomonadaceae bacterium]
MTKQRSRRRRSLFANMLVTAMLALTGQPGVHGRASAVDECEGDACAQVTVAFDAGKGQYCARNNSAERWVRVTASNLASSARACLGPGREDYLELKSLAGPYRAEYAEPRCGAQGVGE